MRKKLIYWYLSNMVEPGVWNSEEQLTVRVAELFAFTDTEISNVLECTCVELLINRFGPRRLKEIKRLSNKLRLSKKTLNKPNRAVLYQTFTF